MTKDEVTYEMVALVEAETGMGKNAWDMVDPKELIAACANAVHSEYETVIALLKDDIARLEQQLIR
jgi:hypothetical protein